VFFSPELLTHKWKYYKHDVRLWRSSWRGRAPCLTEHIHYNGTRRLSGIGQKLEHQRQWVQTQLLKENFKKPNKHHREFQYPDVTSTDGILPKYLKDTNSKLKFRVMKNHQARERMDPEWKHKQKDKSIYSFLNYTASDPKIFYNMLNIKISSMDRNRLEHYDDFVNRMCRDLELNIEETYALPNKIIEIQHYDNNAMLYVDNTLIQHFRVLQLKDVDVVELNILLAFMKESLPESVSVSIKEHDEHEHSLRFARRKDLEEQTFVLQQLQNAR